MPAKIDKTVSQLIATVSPVSEQFLTDKVNADKQVKSFIGIVNLSVGQFE